MRLMKLTSYNNKLIYINPNIVVYISEGEGAYKGYTYIQISESMCPCVKESVEEATRIWEEAMTDRR